MERKYKQRGYMEDSAGATKTDRAKRPEREKGIRHYGMRNGGTARSGIRCARCGKTMNLMGEVALDAKCESCSTDFHTCTNCAFFSTSSRWECSKPIPARVAPKDSVMNARSSVQQFLWNVPLNQTRRHKMRAEPLTPSLRNKF